MKHAIKALGICFLIFSINLHAQENKKLDSLLQVYKTLPNDTSKVALLGDLYLATLYNDTDKAKNYAYERLDLAKQLDYEKGMADAYYHIGGYHRNVGQLDSARVYFGKALKIFKDYGNLKGEAMTNHAVAIMDLSEGKYDVALETTNKNIKIREKMQDSTNLAMEYNFKGGIYETKGHYRIAYENVLKALSIYDKIDEPIWKADALNSLGSLEGTFENYQKSNAYSKQALEIYKEHNDVLFQAVSNNAIGQNYINLEDYESSKKHLEESIAQSKEMNILLLQGGATRNLGRAYVAQNQYEKGIQLLEEAVAIHRETGRPIALIRSLYFLGSAYNENNNPEKALSIFNEAMEIAKSSKSLGAVGEIYEGKSRSKELMSMFELSLLDHKEFKRLKDSVLKSDKIKQIEELKTIYETEKKEREIVLQENEINHLQQEARISNLQRILLGIALLLSLIGFYAVRQKLKLNKAEKEKMDAELAFKRKELTTHALHLAKKNETLEGLKQKVKELKTSENPSGYQQLISTINFDLQDDNNWKNFSKYFEEVHKDFNTMVKTKFPEVTPNELRLMALLKMNLSSKEIANILNISQEGIKKARYRLRKKLDISSEDSLQDLVLSL